jgi:hypothetical protein
MITIYTAIAIFGLTALLGLYLLSLILRNKQTPKGASMIHGFFAVVGLVLLIVYCIRNDAGPLAAIIAFSLAALGGFILFYKDVTGATIPKWLGIVHGVTAVVGYGLLLWFAFC